MFSTAKELIRMALNDFYTILMLAAVIYALSFLCQPFERGLMRVLLLVIFVDGVMRIAMYLFGGSAL